MINVHFTTAFNSIPLVPNPNDGHLIYYGIINVLPGYIFSLIFGMYYTCSHITIFALSLVASFYVFKIAKLAGVRQNIAYITAVFLLLYPIWLGHSFFNYKDIPAAVFFTMYSYYVCKLCNILFFGKRISKILYFKLILTGALLSATKFAFFPIIIVDSFLLMSVYKGRVVSKLYFGTIVVILTVFVTMVFTPGAWHQPMIYMINDIVLMGKFVWVGCTTLFGQCIITNSQKWNAAWYLSSWYLVQTPLLFIFLFIAGLIYMIKVFLNQAGVAAKIIWVVLLVQLLLLPILAIIHNSTFYNATRHTLFCIPIIVIISGFGLELSFTIFGRYARNIILSILSLLALGVIIDDILLNPYQYIYFNELSRHYISNENTENDYWGFSLRETYESIDMMKYYTPYISLENGPMPGSLTPFMSGNYQFVHYEKNMQMPLNTSVNVIGLVRGNDIDSRINQDRCVLVSEASRALLFKPDRLIMS